MDSNYELALRVADSQTNSQDSEKILKLLDLGVAEGDDRAAYARAVCFANGQYGSSVDELEAFRLFSRISKSKIAEALFDLAVCYDLGQGVEKDQFAAFEFYQRAATLGHTEACAQVSEFFREGVTVPESENLEKFWLERSKMKEREISPPDRVWLR